MEYNYVVLIQIHDEAEKLPSCLESLLNQTILPNLVIIVDDGTPDTSVFKEYMLWIRHNHNQGLNVTYCQGSVPKKPNLDTVGKAMNYVFHHKVCIGSKPKHDYLSIIDVDTLPSETYYEQILDEMKADPDLICASGVIHAGGKKEELISAKVIKRKDARGSGKVVRCDFLANIPLEYFPEVAWDTWINTKAKLAGKKALQLAGIVLYSSRPTTRVSNRDNFRDGRLTYHFGYNPLLLLYKVVFRGLDVLRGYLDARKKQWKLPDDEVRKWFGWGYLFRFWK